jgi:1,4-dihydroxy-2-naphthoyl-CoA synthase
MEMLLTGDMVTAQDAVKIGLINRAVPPENVRAEVMALAAKIAAKPYATIRTGKHAFYEQAEMTLADAYAYAAQVMTENMLHAESREGIGAFLEKREPAWPK